MKYIQKGKEPIELIEYKKNPEVNYSTLSKEPEVRDTVKKALLDEQGYICCYCGKRIELDGITGIEHFKPKSLFPEDELNYENLHVVCDGGAEERKNSSQMKKSEKNRRDPLYCGAFKDNKVMRLSPLQADVEEQFRYYSNGEIKGLSVEAEEAIGKLHLNNYVLVNKRKAVIEFFENQEYMAYTAEQWDEEIKFLEKRDNDGKFKPYCFVAKRYIEESRM